MFPVWDIPRVALPLTFDYLLSVLSTCSHNLACAEPKSNLQQQVNCESSGNHFHVWQVLASHSDLSGSIFPKNKLRTNEISRSAKVHSPSCTSKSNGNFASWTPFPTEVLDSCRVTFEAHQDFKAFFALGQTCDAFLYALGKVQSSLRVWPMVAGWRKCFWAISQNSCGRSCEDQDIVWQSCSKVQPHRPQDYPQDFWVFFMQAPNPFALQRSIRAHGFAVRNMDGKTIWNSTQLCTGSMSKSRGKQKKCAMPQRGIRASVRSGICCSKVTRKHIFKWIYHQLCIYQSKGRHHFQFLASSKVPNLTMAQDVRSLPSMLDMDTWYEA